VDVSLEYREKKLFAWAKRLTVKTNEQTEKQTNVYIFCWNIEYQGFLPLSSMFSIQFEKRLICEKIFNNWTNFQLKLL